MLTLAAVAAAQGVSVLEKGWKGTEVTVEAKAAEKKVEDGEKIEAKEKKSRPVKITSDSTVYNRKEGLACFNGNVFVDDEQYQLHADRVFVMMEGTNELKRIVAVGNVAIRYVFGSTPNRSKSTMPTSPLPLRPAAVRIHSRK